MILPAIGKEKVAALTRDDVKRLFVSVAKQTPIRANRMLSLLHRMLNLAATEFNMREGPNPAAAIERKAEHRRTRYLGTLTNWLGCWSPSAATGTSAAPTSCGWRC